MLSDMIRMIAENKYCILSTCDRNLPNTSLMQYIYDPATNKIYMLTGKDSIKYDSIRNNPNVSLLMDTRTSGKPAREIKALTVYGRAVIVEDKALESELIGRLLAAHESLANLAQGKNARVIEVSVDSLLLFDGVDQGMRINLEAFSDGDQ